MSSNKNILTACGDADGGPGHRGSRRGSIHFEACGSRIRTFWTVTSLPVRRSIVSKARWPLNLRNNELIE
jgi:hypothetical protein